jgi:hypothetical protein
MRGPPNSPVAELEAPTDGMDNLSINQSFRVLDENNKRGDIYTAFHIRSRLVCEISCLWVRPMLEFSKLRRRRVTD